MYRGVGEGWNGKRAAMLSRKILEKPLLPVGASGADAASLLFFAFLGCFSVLAAVHGGRRRSVLRAICRTCAFFFFVYMFRQSFCFIRDVVFSTFFLGRDDARLFFLVAFFVLVSSLAMVGGACFCGWICPIGTLQDILAVVARGRLRFERRIGGRLLRFVCLGACLLAAWSAWEWIGSRGSDAFFVSENLLALQMVALLLLLPALVLFPRLDRPLRRLRSVSLAASIFLVLAGIWLQRPGCLLYDDEYDPGMIAAFLALVFASTMVVRPFCKYMCPFWAYFRLFVPFAPLEVEWRSEGCSSCGSCESVCPTGALSAAGIDRLECICCTACAEHCGANVRFRTRPPQIGIRGGFFLASLLLVAGVLGLGGCTPHTVGGGGGRTQLLRRFKSSVVLPPWGPWSEQAREGRDSCRRGEWPLFQGDAQRSGLSGVVFPEAQVESLHEVWRFSPAEHLYSRRRGGCIWSRSVCATVRRDGGMSIVAGFYDGVVYCLDATDGRVLWKYVAGASVEATPVLGELRDGEKVLFVCAADRSIHCIRLEDGSRVWSRSLVEWNEKLSEAEWGEGLWLPSALSPWPCGGVFVASVWYSDGIGGGQYGKVVAWRASSGEPVAELVLCGTPLSGLALLPGGDYVCGDASGVLYRIRSNLSSIEWRVRLDGATGTVPTVVRYAGGAVVACTTRFGVLHLLEAADGRTYWSFKSGNWLLGSCALSPRGLLMFGSRDYSFYAVDIEQGSMRRRFTLRDAVVSSPAAALLCKSVSAGGLRGGKQRMGAEWRVLSVVISMDDRLHLFDVSEGVSLRSFQAGPLPWPFYDRDSATFSSPAIVEVRGRPGVVFPAHDMTLRFYAPSTPPAVR